MAKTLKHATSSGRKASWCRLVFLLAVGGLPLWAAIAAPQQSAPGKSGLPLLTKAAQVRNLSHDQAALGQPVRLRAVVTYYESEGPDGPDLFVQDSTAGIWVDTPGMKLGLEAGQLVELSGFTAFADFAPQIIKPNIRVLGRASLPVPRRASFERLASTAEDSQWMEIEGIVRHAEVQNTYLVLEIAAAGGRLEARIPGFHQPVPARLVDAQVRVRGACGAIFNQRNQMVGVRVYVPNLAQLKVIEPSPPDPFAISVRSISSLLRFTPQGASGHRVRVQGVVILKRRDGLLFVTDDAESVAVRTLQALALQPGDRVEVLGFPSFGEYSPSLADATVRRVAKGSAPPAISITAAQALQGSHDASLVRLEARLLDHAREGNDLILALQSQDVIFDARIEETGAVRQVGEIPLRSRLQVTGVCSVEADKKRQPRAFRLLLRSPADVVVLERPPWWTLRHALVGLGTMASLILAVLGWVVLLRRRVLEQTATIREWGQREAALRDRFHELFENANDIVFTCGLRGHITSLNLAGERILGYSRPEAIGQNILEWVAPEHRSLVEQIIQSGVPQQAAQEIEILTKEGRRVPLEVSLRPIYSGEYPVGVQGIARDITERKRAEDQLRKLSQAVEQSPVCVIITNTNGIIEYVNPKFTSLTGYTLEEAVGNNPRILKSGETPPEAYRELWATITSGREWRGEFHNKKKNGDFYWESAAVMPIKDAAGSTTHFLAVKEDITEQKGAKEALLESESKFRNLFAYSPLPMFFYDLETLQYLEVNDAAVAHYGYCREEFLNMRLADLRLEEDVPQTLRDVRTLLTNPRWSGQTRHRLKDGRTIEVEMTALALDWHGRKAVLAVAQDITARKLAERELQNAKEAAEAATRAKSAFLANMSHEIRTPMNGILGMTELVLDTHLDAEQREYLEMVKSSSNSLLTVINDVLDFSKIEAGKFELDLIEFNLRDNLEQTIRALALRAHQKGLELTCKVRPVVPERIIGDPGRLRQIIINLVGNAIKFTNQGEVSVRVDLDSRLEGAVGVHFEVIDTGIGIPPEKQKIIFEAFAQADGSSTRKYGGTGLGLTICRQLVEMMGGRIWVESELGNGSTFHFVAQFGRVAPSFEKRLAEEGTGPRSQVIAEEGPFPEANASPRVPGRQH